MSSWLLPLFPGINIDLPAPLTSPFTAKQISQSLTPAPL